MRLRRGRSVVVICPEIPAHACPGGLWTVMLTGCGVVLASEALSSVTAADRATSEHADLVESHVESCPCGTVVGLIYDGDDGHLMTMQVVEIGD